MPGTENCWISNGSTKAISEAMDARRGNDIKSMSIKTTRKPRGATRKADVFGRFYADMRMSAIPYTHKKHAITPAKPSANPPSAELPSLDSKTAVSAAGWRNAQPPTQLLEMPAGSGAIVLFAKRADNLVAAAVIALKGITAEAGKNPLWTTVESIVIAQHLEQGDGQAVWADLLKFRAYRMQHATPSREPVALPEGSGAIVLYGKTAGGLKTVEVTAVPSVSVEPGKNLLWTKLENVLMPNQLSFEQSQDAWSDLLRFRAHGKQLASRQSGISRSAAPKV